MEAPETRAVAAALGADGAEVRFVGGCVRDAVAQRAVKDIDLATPDPPETVIALLERAALRAVPTGLAHGTVTAIADGRPFEVTTLRVDVETYGRHAKVAFTDDWEADAARRDFTFNAMSCAPDGRLYDPFDGQRDLQAGRVRFVGDARARVREDYLRLLRFFRFHAHYGRAAPDPEALAVARELAGNLATLSGERLRTELLRLLEAADPVPTCDIMLEREILTAVLPEATNTAALAALIGVEPVDLPPDPLRRLAAFLDSDGGTAGRVAVRLRLSRSAGERLMGLMKPSETVRIDPDLSALRRSLYRLGRERMHDLLLLAWARGRAAGAHLDSSAFNRALGEIAAWDDKAFPLQGQDVRDLGVPEGPRIGRLLSEVESWWLAEDFQPDRDACLERLRASAAAG